MKTTYRTITATAVLSCVSAGLFAVAPASAMPGPKHNHTITAPIVQQVHYKRHYWKKKQRCHWVKKTHWHKGHKHVKMVKVCR